MNAQALDPKKYWQPLLILAASAFVYANVFVKLFADWGADENYSHGLLVPFIIGFILWTERENLAQTAKNPSVLIGGVLIAAAFFLLLAGTLGAELFLQRISPIFMAAGIVILFFGTKILQKLVVPFVLFALAVPIPQIIFNKIALPLQVWASQLAIWGIRLFAVPSVRKGNVIEILPQGATQIVSLEVVEACSGIRSLMTLVTLALVMAYFTRRNSPPKNFAKNRDVWRTLLLMAAAVPIAILTNAARVAATGILTYNYGKKAADGFAHEFSGWLVYLVAFLLLLATNFILLRFFKSAATATDFDSPETFVAPVKFSVARTIFLVSAMICGGILINYFENRGEISVARAPLSEMPARLGEWQQKGKDIRFGEQTESVLRTTDYVMRDYFSPEGRRANVYVGYYASQKSGATYHSPQNCLPGSGWELKNYEPVEIKTVSGKTFTANRYIINTGNYSEVLIYWYQGRGRAAASEYSDKVFTVIDGILRRRSDGAMIRIMTPAAGADDEKAIADAVAVSAEVAETLTQFVPE